ncbi:MAG: glycoside hydrolase family 31 protein [Clostridia bacterium]|nr:glycoside hydrolase family 31 protein [Clostridia bacterium]
MNLNTILTKVFSLFLALIGAFTLFSEGLINRNLTERLKPFWGGNKMTVSDIDAQENAIFFTADGVKCELQFTSPHGWRLRTAKDDGTFDDFGAGQTLARDLDETVEDLSQPLTKSSNNSFTAPDGSRAELVNGKGIVIYLPSGEKAYNVDVIFRDSAGALHIAGGLDRNERLYGTGEKYNSLNQRGMQVDVFSMDVWSVEDGRSYIQIPIVASSRGCGLFMNRFEHQIMDLGHYAKNRFDFELTHGTCDLYIFTTEKISEVLYGYSVITGFASEPAEWMYGTQVCRYAPEFSTAQGVYNMAENMEANGFPWDAVIIEGFDAFNRSRWNELQEISDFVRGKGKHLMIYTACGFGGGYNDEYLVHDGTGSSSLHRVYSHEVYGGYGHLSSSTQSYVDITNPTARQWMLNGTWKELMTRFHVEGAKVDFCENVPDYMTSPESTLTFYDGRTTAGAHQWYPAAYTSLLFNMLDEYSESGAMVFNRGGGIGTQRYPMSWTGDQMREFTFLKTMLRACLSAGLSGIPFMSYDMAGYSRSKNPDLNPEAEVYVRGLEYTCFSTNIESHGTVKRPYDFDDATKNIYRIYSNMHDAMRPYLVEFGKIATETAMPLMRALVLYDQDDDNCQSIWDEYMLGDAFLVAPALNRGQLTRSIYLPEGSWTDMYTGKVYEGGRTLLLYKTPIAKVPVFINNNSQSETLSETLAAMQPYIAEINALS